MIFTIYAYKSPSNKYYIGITNNEPRRKIEHKKKELGGYDDTKFTRAIKKYGFDNLEYIVLDNATTIEEAKTLEIKYIKQYDSYKNGYNSTLGGDWITTRAKLTEDEVKEIRLLLEENKLLMIQIAEKYSVSESVISDIYHNKRWKFVPSMSINRTKMTRKGSTNGQSKLTEKLVKEIKLKLSQGISRKELMNEYNVSKSNIQMIATGQSWSHVSVPEYEYKKVRNGNTKLTENQVKNIWIDRKSGMIQKELINKYNISRSTVQNILRGKIWKDIYKEMT